MIQVILIMLMLTLFIYWVSFYAAYTFGEKADKTENTSPEPISVIISCKNAEKTIEKTIYSILSQKYVDFELIIIDDFSTDQTVSIVQKIQDSRIILLSAKVDVAGKKAALTQAIQSAKNEILLFTDADCIPASTQWIKSMAQTLFQIPETEVVLGYGPMNKKNTWINKFARYETWLTAVQFFSYAIFKMPYMGVGRNLMYKKSAFLRVNGFNHHEDVASGDDDLFISSVANRRNITVNMDPNAFVYSEAKDQLATFFRQKTRHISTSVRYKLAHQVLLSIFAAAQSGIYLVLILGLIMNVFHLQTIFFILLSKWIMQSLLHYQWMQRLDSKDLWLLFPILDIMMSVYYFIVSCFSIFRNKNTW
jgi:glycosyltransferase involved in cell wall biosynthesis